MTSRIARILLAALLLGLAGLAPAAPIPIDLDRVAGVPGTGGYSTVMGPCYCDQQAWFSPIILLAPGTYDFGTLREYWVQSGYTPDGGDYQDNLYLLFGPVAGMGDYFYDFPPPADYAWPSYALCSWDDVACNAGFRGAYEDMALVFTVQPGQNAIQLGFIGNYRYTSPAPEPSGLAMLALGAALAAALARRRGRR